MTHTDWLHHRLVVRGPTDAAAEFQNIACGSGIIPWQLDLDRVREDAFHLLMSPAAPQRRRLSLAGAHALSAQLRDAVALRHSVAVAPAGHSQACKLDLHALVPIPSQLLSQGPDDAKSLAWLRAHWGTTAALRRVTREISTRELSTRELSRPRTPLPSDTATVRFTFWSADWTPWQALAAAARRWPTLRFDIRPTYGAP